MSKGLNATQRNKVASGRITDAADVMLDQTLHMIKCILLKHETAQLEVMAEMKEEIEGLRDLLGKANALCRIRQERIKELVRCIERMRVAGGSHEFQMAFELAKDAIGHGKDTTLTDDAATKGEE